MIVWETRLSTMSTSVFDNQGRAWDLRSPSLRAALNCPAPDFDLLKYLVENIGYVAVTKAGRGAGAYVRIRPAVASPIGLAAALYDLAETRPQRIILSHSGGSGGHEMFVSFPAAVKRIGELMLAVGSNASPPFLNRERDVRSLKSKDPLSALLRHWSGGERFSPDAHEDLLCTALRGRFMNVKLAYDRLTISGVGPGFLAFDASWRRRAPGLPLEHQPDYMYGLWVRDIFKSVLDQWRPRLDEVDAVIRRPTFGDQVRIRYRRLILPYRRAPSGSARLLGVSVVDETVDLRSAGGMAC